MEILSGFWGGAKPESAHTAKDQKVKMLG